MRYGKKTDVAILEAMLNGEAPMINLDDFPRQESEDMVDYE